MTQSPDSRLTLIIDQKEHEIFMSFGLVAELAGIVGSIERVPAIDLDPDLAVLLINRTLAPRTKSGKMVDPDFEAPDVDQEVAIAILDFVARHVLSFFIQGLQRGLRRLDSNKELLEQVGSLLNSTTNSNSPISSV